MRYWRQKTTNTVDHPAYVFKDDQEQPVVPTASTLRFCAMSVSFCLIAEINSTGLKNGMVNVSFAPTNSNLAQSFTSDTEASDVMLFGFPES